MSDIVDICLSLTYFTLPVSLYLLIVTEVLFWKHKTSLNSTVKGMLDIKKKNVYLKKCVGLL